MTRDGRRLRGRVWRRWFPKRRFGQMGRGVRRRTSGGQAHVRLAAHRFDDELMARRRCWNRSIGLAKKEGGANGLEMTDAQHQSDLPGFGKILLEIGRAHV